MELSELTSKYQLQLLLAFGSYGTERFTPMSDLDIAYESATELSAACEEQLLTDLIFYFKRDRIDLVNLKKAEPLLAYEVACHSKVLFEAVPGSFLRHKLKASARFADTRFLRDARKRWLNQQVKQEGIKENSDAGN